MKSVQNLIVSRLLQIFVRLFCQVTGKGGGKFAPFLPKQQTFLVEDYCGQFKFNVDTTYPIEASVWLAGVYDVATTKFLRRVLREDDVFLDIGANCGALTLVVASQIQTGKVYAFEPGPSIRNRLQANVAINPKLANRVQVVPYGLGAENGQLFYHEDPNYRGNGALTLGQGFQVDVLTLDEWVASEKLNKIDVIKIDVEGMEYEVLKGGRSVLEKYHPAVIYFETLSVFFVGKPYTIGTLYEFLAALGYQIFDPKQRFKPVPLAGPYPANSVAVHSSCLDRIGR